MTAESRSRGTMYRNELVSKTGTRLSRPISVADRGQIPRCVPLYGTVARNGGGIPLSVVCPLFVFGQSGTMGRVQEYNSLLAIAELNYIRCCCDQSRVQFYSSVRHEPRTPSDWLVGGSVLYHVVISYLVLIFSVLIILSLIFLTVQNL